ncbi:MAG TPA: GNAT family N-acetyltransferase [Treponemataceae bacterium]|nr:GNAT family N-acetyltransferase [Treponemataceae bacterium]
MINIYPSKDPEKLAVLNECVQDIHTNIEPELFKKYDKKEMIELFNEIIKDENTFIFIVAYQEIDVGYIILSRVHYPETNFRKAYESLYIEQISINQEYQKLGIGKELINKAKQVATSLGINRIELDYWSKNRNAGQFFESQGFNPYNVKMCFTQ